MDSKLILEAARGTLDGSVRAGLHPPSAGDGQNQNQQLT
jgi:hypothetical protein